MANSTALDGGKADSVYATGVDGGTADSAFSSSIAAGGAAADYDTTGSSGDDWDALDGGNAASTYDLGIDGGTAESIYGTVIDGGYAASVYGTPVVPPYQPPAHPYDSRVIWLESMDGNTVIPLNTDADRILMAGATGLQIPPHDIITAQTPGVPGSQLQEINVLERSVFLPLDFASDASQSAFFASLQQLRRMIVTTPGTYFGQVGTFRIGVRANGGEDRLLAVVYKSGWEGSWGGADGGYSRERIPLTLTAVDPYWRARTPTTRTYQVAGTAPFLGTGDNTNPWPRRISASVVIGSGMDVAVDGEVPVWPTVTLAGPSPSASLSWTGTNITIPNGVADGSQLVLVTDPRARSARLDGAIGWSRIALGSTFAPLLPGSNMIDVEVETLSEDAELILSWIPGWESAW